MSMKTLKELQGKAQHLSNCLPEGSVFSIDSAFDGYRFHFDNGDGPISCCGYEKPGVVKAQFQAASTVLDGIHRSKCKPEDIENLMGEFRDFIEAKTETLEHEITLLANLAGALMREIHKDKAQAIIERVICKAREEDLLMEIS